MDPLAALPPGQFPGQLPEQLPEQLPGQLQAPAQPGPGLPAKELDAQPGQGEPAADSGEPTPDAEVPYQRGRPCEAGGRRKSEDRGAARKAGAAIVGRGTPAQQPSTLQSSAQAEQSKAPASQEPTIRTDIPVPVDRRHGTCRPRRGRPVIGTRTPSGEEVLAGPVPFSIRLEPARGRPYRDGDGYRNIRPDGRFLGSRSLGPLRLCGRLQG